MRTLTYLLTLFILVNFGTIYAQEKSETRQDSVNIAFKAGSGGIIKGDKFQTIPKGGTCSPVEAIPDDGFKFVKWKGDYAGTENPLTLKGADKNMTITAGFQKRYFEVIAGPGGRVNGKKILKIDVDSVMSVKLKANPDPGYKFKKWTGDYTGTENPITLKINPGGGTLTANFMKESIIYTVKFAADANGKITGSKTQKVESGGSCSEVKAVPNKDYKFLKWTGDHTGKDNPLTITNVTKNMNITAEFQKDYFEVIAGHGGKVNGKKILKIDVDSVMSVKLTAQPDFCYAFKSWTKSNGKTLTNNPITIIPKSGQKIIANFKRTHCLVKFAVGPDSKLIGENPQKVEVGGDCTPVEVIPPDDQTFVGWTGDYTGKENPLTITNVTKDMKISANFKKKTYTVSFGGGNGADLIGESPQEVEAGGDCTPVEVVPHDGLEFVEWKGPFTTKQNPITVTNVNKNMAFAYVLKLIPYTVKFEVGPDAKLAGEKHQEVEKGKDCTPVEVIPNDGYKFVGWTGDHTGIDNPLTITNVTKNMIITANCEKKLECLVTFKVDSNGSIEGDLKQEVKSGGDCSEVKAVPNKDYQFFKWTGDYTGTENPLTITKVTKDMTITAEFCKIYTINIIAGPGGKVNGKKVLTLNLAVGQKAKVTAQPDPGYGFGGWTGLFSGAGNPMIVNGMLKNTQSSVKFKIIPYTIKFEVGPDAKLVGEKHQEVEKGKDCTPVEVIPNNGFKFVGWTGGHTGTENPLTITNVKENMVIGTKIVPEVVPIINSKEENTPHTNGLILGSNPVSSGDFVYFSLHRTPQGPVEVVVYDPMGNKVHEQKHLKPWKVEGISQDSYLVVIKYGGLIIKEIIGVK